MEKGVKEKIISIALKKFLQQGYKKTKIEEIAFEIGRGHPAIYYYFENKEDLFRAVISNEINNLINSLKAISNQSYDPQQRLRLYLSSRMQNFRIIFTFFEIIRNEFAKSSNFINSIRKKLDNQEFDLIILILKDGNKRNIFHIENTDNVAKAIIYSMSGLETLFYSDLAKIDFKTDIEELLNVLFYGLVKR